MFRFLKTWKYLNLKSIVPKSRFQFCNKVIQVDKVPINFRPQFMEWYGYLINLENNFQNFNQYQFQKFLSLTIYLELEEINEYASNYFLELLNSNILFTLSESDLCLLVEALAKIKLDFSQFSHLSDAFFKLNITSDKILVRFYIGFSILEEKNGILIQAISNYFDKYFETNMNNIDTDQFIPLLEYFYFSCLHKNQKLHLLPIFIKKILGYFEKQNKEEYHSIAIIASAFPRLIFNHVQQEEIFKKYIEQLQSFLKKIEFSKIEDLLIILNNINIYAPNYFQGDILSFKLKDILIALTGFDNQSLFHTFFLICSIESDKSNKKLLKLILNDIISLINLIDKDSEIAENDLYFHNEVLKKLNAIQEKNDISDKKFEILFNILYIGARVCPISFFDYESKRIIQFYKNMIKILE